MTELLWKLLAVPLLITLNAFFVASEYALVAIRPVQLEAMRRAGRGRAADAMHRLQSDPASAIGAIQVCITMTNLLLGWIGEPAMSAALGLLFGPAVEAAPRLFGTASLVFSFLVITLLTVVFGELLPKAMTLRYVIAATRLSAIPILAIRNAVRPLVWLMNVLANTVTRPLGLGRIQAIDQQHLTSEELRLITIQAAADGVLTPQERSLILNTLSLGGRPVRHIVIPRTQVAWLDLQKSMDENRQVMNEHLYSRLPLCDGSMDRVVVVVHTKEFLSAFHAAGDTRVLSLIARPPVFVPEQIPLDQLLTVFHERRTQIAFAVDEYGGVEGIVTLKDVVDELVGEIRETPDVERRQPTLPIAADASGGPFVAPGNMPLHDLARQIQRPEWCADCEAATLSGLIVSQMNRVPRAGEEATVENVRLRVVESDERVVYRAEVTPLPIKSTED